MTARTLERHRPPLNIHAAAESLGFDPGWGLYGSDDDSESVASSRRGRVGLHRPSALWKPDEFWPGYRQALRAVEEQLLAAAPSCGVGVPNDWEIRALRECAASGSVCEGEVRMIPGRPKQCYANVAHTYWADPTFQIWIGFGLFKTVWHEHCWGLTDEGVIIETTLSWDAYFGVPVPRDEAKEVAWELIEGEHPRRRTPGKSKKELWESYPGTDSQHGVGGNARTMSGVDVIDEPKAPVRSSS